MLPKTSTTFGAQCLRMNNVRYTKARNIPKLVPQMNINLLVYENNLFLGGQVSNTPAWHTGNLGSSLSQGDT